MSILRRLHAGRLAVIFGSALLCLLGVVAGCDSGDTQSSTKPADIKTKQQDESAARKAAFGNKGVPGKGAPAK